MRYSVILSRVLLLLAPLSGAAAGVDPLTAEINTEDADRFVSIYETSGGSPSAADLDAGYIGPGTDGLRTFIPNRIENGEHLANKIVENSSEYRRAIDICLPVAKASTGELRAVYLALEGLLGDPDLPAIYALFGAGNSGGTAGPDLQVIGLEVICRDADSEEKIRAVLRSFYAHETVHTLQTPGDSIVEGADPLLTSVLQEGTADYVASLVTGREPSPERAAWAKAREKELWKAFAKDRRAMKKLSPDKQYEKGSPIFRWIANVGSPPEGWPGELGYWLGMEIAAAYVDAADDKRAAIKELIHFTDPEPILEKSGYAKRFK